MLVKTWQTDDLFSSIAELAKTNPALASRAAAVADELLAVICGAMGVDPARHYLATLHLNSSGPGTPMSGFGRIVERS